MTGSAELRRRYVEELRRDGLLPSPDLVRAFDAVPREEFVASGFHGGGERWIQPSDPDFLTLVYRNHPLVTKIVDGMPVSSSSQPSLMAAMIDALDLRPGTRVLEIGVGTGYNAALMATMGARVTAIDIAPDVVDRAGAALARVGLADLVDVRLGDGYLGEPANAPYDRVIVTVGVTGMSPRWLDQLAPGGFGLAPVEHAGNHPVLRFWAGGPGVAEARGAMHAGFMSAAGPLAARYAAAHPEPGAAMSSPSRRCGVPAAGGLRWTRPATTTCGSPSGCGTGARPSPPGRPVAGAGRADAYCWTRSTAVAPASSPTVRCGPRDRSPGGTPPTRPGSGTGGWRGDSRRSPTGRPGWPWPATRTGRSWYRTAGSSADPADRPGSRAGHDRPGSTRNSGELIDRAQEGGSGRRRPPVIGPLRRVSDPSDR